MPPLPKPDPCRGCSLDTLGTGFAPPEGPTTSPLLWMGEALGGTEAALGRPFVGDAGGMLQRLLKLLNLRREDQRIGNVISCRPPNDWMDGTPQAPWFHGSIAHCNVYRQRLLNEPHQVVIALGSTALKTLMELHGHKKIRVNDFHGAILRDPSDRFWVVPTFHPSFLQRGAHNLIGTVLWDLQQAQYAAAHGKPADDHSLIIDPPVEWFRAWVEQAIAARQQDPWAYPVSSDIETPDKAGGRDEGELGNEDQSFQILRWNVSINPDEGVTVPYAEPYISELRRLHRSPGPIWGWNFIGYDFARVVAADIMQERAFPQVIDLMWLWHRLQSDLPRGLGFAAPFYSAYGPWKHISEKEPGRYGAVDGLQNHRVGFGVMRDLESTGLLASALRYVHQLMYQALRPAQIIGVQADKVALAQFKQELGVKATALLDQIQESIPDSLKPLTPKQGLTKKPADNLLHVKASAFTRKGEKRAGKEQSEIKLDLYKRAVVVERTELRDVLVCTTCGASEIQRRHRCAKDLSTWVRPLDPAGSGDSGERPEPAVVVESRPVARWYWQEPFNPDSPDQVLAYIKYKKHPVGRAKKTQKESTNKETLKKLTRTGDPFYARLLDYRAVMKAKGTYADGTERRMDHAGRVHPEPTFAPSTARLSYVNPNITNVIADKSGKDNIAAGFRKCIVATATNRLLEVDFGGSEQVDFGWLIKDPNHIRLAALGIHSGVASYKLAEKYPNTWQKFDPAWDDKTLGAYFKSIKESKDEEVAIIYDTSKRFVHGFAYGLTLQGMVLQFPEFFSSLKIAEGYADLFMHLSPQAVPWHRLVREQAHIHHFLGGPGDVRTNRWAHPFGFKHWFWSVYTHKKITAGQYWKAIGVARRKGWSDDQAPVMQIEGQYFKVSLGEDGKRCVAFLPQSITAGKLQEVMLRLFDPALPSYIGDHGEILGMRQRETGVWEYDPHAITAVACTPLRAPIHDSLLLEIPARKFELVAETVFREMQRPFQEMPVPDSWGFGPYLATPVSAKTGKPGGSWAAMEKLSVPGFAELGVGSDRILTAPTEDLEEDVDDFAREIA